MIDNLSQDFVDSLIENSVSFLNNSEMENKYYIPKIEEFYIGFRYQETHSHLLDNLEDFGYSVWEERFKDKMTYEEFKQPSYCPEVFNLNTDIILLKASIECGDVRVKYLDKKDIEELGWIKDSGDLDFILDTYQLEIIAKDYKNPGENIYLITADFGYYNLFMGKLKNYNELKKVMEQLNIKKNDSM